MSQPAAREESRALLSSLNDQREHVLGILEGLPSEALGRPVLPSGWTCLGLVQHLAIDATHAGHLDAVRELMDGRTWLILT